MNNGYLTKTRLKKDCRLTDALIAAIEAPDMTTPNPQLFVKSNAMRTPN